MAEEIDKEKKKKPEQNPIPDLKDFVAIDFEAANAAFTSVCSMGVVIVKNREIVKTYYSLIKPVPNFYDFYTTKIHGLKKKDTDNAPIFPQVWNAIKNEIKELPIVAHGKAFEDNCLKALFKYYHIRRPRYQIYCTHRASEILFPELENHKLQTVAAHCGYDLTKHHHALADAEACAVIAIKVFDVAEI